MDITIKITELLPEQKGMNVHYSTRGWPEGRTVFMLFPLDATGAVLEGDDLLEHLASLAPVTECEQRESLAKPLNLAPLEALVDRSMVADVMTAAERKVAQILAADAAADAAAAAAPALADMVPVQP